MSAAKAWLDAVEHALGVRPMIYSGLSFATEHLGAFGAYPLWVAEYNSQSEPSLPPAWSTWQFWQHSDKGSIPGITGAVDLDVHNGPLGATPGVSESPAAATTRTYTVEPGDTLSGIAQRFGTTIAAVADANNIINPADVKAGLVLQIP